MRISPTLPVFGVAIALVAGALGCSGSQANMTVSAAVTSDPAVSQTLAVSCYDCHSNEGANQWYAKLQPSRWFGDPALEELNFSNWESYDALRKKDTINQIAAVVDSGTMPPRGYLLFHPGARLSAEQKAAIARWTAAQGALAAH